MKKIFALILVALVSLSVFATDVDQEELQKRTKYLIEFGAGLQWDNNDGWDNDANRLRFGVILPVHERFRIGFEGKFDDKLEKYVSDSGNLFAGTPGMAFNAVLSNDKAATATTFAATRYMALNDGSTSFNYWSALNNYGRLAVGIPVLVDKLHVALFIGGGTEEMKLLTDAKGSDNYMIGHGLLDFGWGLYLKSDLFGGKLSKFEIENDWFIYFGGTGYGIRNLGGNPFFIFPEDVETGDGDKYVLTHTSNDQDLWQYGGFKTKAKLKVEVPIHELAGITNLTKLAYGIELEGEAMYKNYTAARVRDTNDTLELNNYFEAGKLPSKTYGKFSFLNYLHVAPDSSTEFKVKVKPGFELKQYKYTLTFHDDITAVSKGSARKFNNAAYEMLDNELFIEFELWGKKKFELGAAFGIVPFLEMDVTWKLAFDQVAYSTPTSYNGVYSFQTASIDLDPGIKLGLQFGNFETSIKWNPSATYDLGGDQTSTSTTTRYWVDRDGDGNFDSEDDFYAAETVTSNNAWKAQIASASNIWNLANWKFEIKCEFPPPEK